MRLIIFSLYYCFCVTVIGQSLITVQVLDEKTKVPLDSVTVRVNQTDSIVFTNARGFFQIDLPTESTLTLSRKGYFDLQFEPLSESSFKVVMKKNKLDTPEYY